MSRLRRRAGRGFSLLELLVALAVMAISLVMLYQVEAGAVRGVGDYAMHQRARLLAQSVLDSRDAIPAAGVREGARVAGFDWQLVSAPLPLPPGLDTGAVPLHEVRVTVRWEGRGGTSQLELATLLPQALATDGESAR